MVRIIKGGWVVCFSVRMRMAPEGRVRPEVRGRGWTRAWRMKVEKVHGKTSGTGLALKTDLVSSRLRHKP